MDNHSFHPDFTATPVDHEDNDNFDFLQQQDHPDDNYWLSQEQIDEMNQVDIGACARVCARC